MLQAAHSESSNLWDLSVVRADSSEHSSDLTISDVKNFEAYHRFLNRLLIAYIRQSTDSKQPLQVDWTIVSLGRQIWKECQLFRLYHALIDYFNSGKVGPIPLIQVPSGATPIEAEGWLSWLNAPLAGLHEELGMLLSFYAYLANDEQLMHKGRKLVEWQKQLIQSDNLPLSELFSLEGKETRKKHLVQSYAFYLVAAWVHSSGDLLEVADHTASKLREVWDSEVEERLTLGMLMLGYLKKRLKAPSKRALEISSTLCDPHTSLVAKRTSNGYGYATLSGGGSGLGTYRYKGVQILTWGPQISSLGDCDRFGIFNPCYHPFRKNNNTQLSASSDGFSIAGNVKVGLRRLKNLSEVFEAPEGGDWFKTSQSLNKEGVQMSWNWLKSSSNETSSRRICWYIKACDCQLLTDKIRMPLRSLEHFSGESQPVLFSSNEGKMLFSGSKSLKMDLIPLAGSGDFWGADYLLSLETPCNHKISTEWSFLN